MHVHTYVFTYYVHKNGHVHSYACTIDPQHTHFSESDRINWHLPSDILGKCPTSQMILPHNSPQSDPVGQARYKLLMTRGQKISIIYICTHKYSIHSYTL